MRIVTLPSVFRPRSDSWLLASLVHAEAGPGRRVLDLCTGSGVVALAAAESGAEVSAVDVSRRAALTVRLNARLNGVRVDARRGDLLDAVDGTFDLISANPPYLPADEDEVPTAGARRAWDAGADGRAVLDRICATVPERLRPGGSVLIVQSNVCGNEETLRRLADGGLQAEVVLRRRGEYGPLMRERLERLRSRGGLQEDLGDEEEVVVIRGRRPVSPEPPVAAVTPAAVTPVVVWSPATRTPAG
jgi:release factor glutamine methyltransferase